MAAEGPGKSRKKKSLPHRVWEWTTRGILCGLILVMGLVFGHEVLHWWVKGDKDDQKPALLIPADGLGESGRRHELRFRDVDWQMDAQEVAGGHDRVMAALEGFCRQVAVASPLPDDAPRPAEQEFVHYLSGRPPTRSEVGLCQVYQFEGAFPMTVALRPGKSPAADASPTVAGLGFRVVTWGLAVPRSPEGREGRSAGQWTLYAFHPAGPAKAVIAGLPEVPLPPGGRRLLSLRVAGGGSMVTFQGMAQVGAWKQFFDRWFESQGWRASGTWQSAGAAWHVRYGPPGVAAASADVQIAPDSHGGLTGMVMLNPPVGEKSESNK